MSDVNVQLLRDAMGNEQFDELIFKKSHEFYDKNVRDSSARNKQRIIQGISFVSAVALACAVGKKEMCLSTAALIEAGLIPASIWIHRNIQKSRNEYRERLEKLLSEMRESIPENHRLIGEAVMEDLGVAEWNIPENQLNQRAKKFALVSVRTVAERLIPYVAALFS